MGVFPEGQMFLSFAFLNCMKILGYCMTAHLGKKCSDNSNEDRRLAYVAYSCLRDS